MPVGINIKEKNQPKFEAKHFYLDILDKGWCPFLLIQDEENALWKDIDRQAIAPEDMKMEGIGIAIEYIDKFEA